MKFSGSSCSSGAAVINPISTIELETHAVLNINTAIWPFSLILFLCQPFEQVKTKSLLIMPQFFRGFKFVL